VYGTAGEAWDRIGRWVKTVRHAFVKT
jgi:hypothetical protein